MNNKDVLNQKQKFLIFSSVYLYMLVYACKRIYVWLLTDVFLHIIQPLSACIKFEGMNGGELFAQVLELVSKCKLNQEIILKNPTVCTYVIFNQQNETSFW